MSIPITVLQQTQKAALVEWQDYTGSHRVYVPSESVAADHVELDTLLQGIPYGEPWELLPIGTVNSETVAQSLRNHGVWTKQDVLQNINRVRAALQYVYVQDLKTILDAARK